MARQEANNQTKQPMWQHGAGRAQQHTGSTSQIEGLKEDHIIPTMQALQQTAAIQQVHRRFQELETANVTCRFKTFGRFEMATAILIPLQGLEMAWPF